MKPPYNKPGGPSPKKVGQPPRPPQAAQGGPTGNFRANIMAEQRKKESAAQVRNVLLAILVLGGGFMAVRHFNAPKVTVIREASNGPAKKKLKANGQPEDNSTDSAVGYDELFKGGPATPGTGTAGKTSSADPTIASNDTSGQSGDTDSGRTAKSGPETDDIFVDTTLVLAGPDAGRKTHVDFDRELLTQAMDTGAWVSYRKMLARSIEAAIPLMRQSDGRNRFDEFWKTPHFYEAFMRWQILGRFTATDIYDVKHDKSARELFNWMCTTPKVMEEVLLTIKPEDDSAKVMVFLKDAWTAKPEVAKKYFNLALACAVVFDKPMATKNPGGETNNEAEPMVDPLRRYLWYIEKDEKGKMAGPIDRMAARDLVFVVCSPVISSELEWAVSKMNLTRKSWGNAYGMINYLMERAVKGINPYKEYTFAEILKEGGICGDQSYFCANTARANGIPAMVFVGETDLGGHAWVALKVKDDEWTTGVGRIGGVAKGQTDNPQAGGSITEQEVWLWTDRDHQSEIQTLSVFRHLWLTDYYAATEKKSVAAEVVRLANTLGKSFTETWARLYNVLEDETTVAGDPTKPDILESWKSFAKDMRREFKDNPRMAALATRAETEHIFPYGEAGDAKRSFLRERRRDERNSSEQKDLIAESLKREADLIVKRNDPSAKKDIEHLYDPALRNYGGSVTGFKMIMNDYFNFMKDDPELAKKAVRDIELAFNRVVKSDSGDWFRTKTEAGIVTTIAGFYRQVGEEDRAKMLEKRYEREMAKAERGAL